MTEEENISRAEARLGLTSLVPEAYRLADRIALEAVEREAKLCLEIPCTK